MRFTIDQPPLMEALGSIILATEDRTPKIPMHSMVRVEAFKQKVCLYGHEEEVQMAFTLDANVEEEGHVAVHAKELVELIRGFSAERPVTFEVSKAMKLKVKQSRSAYNLSIMNANDFPQVEYFAPEQYTPLDPTVLLDALKKVTYAREVDDVGRPILKGINFSKADDGTMRVAACDAKQLAVMKIPGVIEGNFTITGRAVKLLEKTLPKIKELGILINGPRAHFCFDRGVFNARVLAGDYPAYGKAFPTGDYSVLILNRKDTIEASKRLMSVASKLNDTFLLDSSEAGIILSAKNSNTDASEELELLPESNIRSPLATAFNGQYLLHVLERLQGEEVSVRIYGPLLPILFSHENYTQLIMPIKR